MNNAYFMKEKSSKYIGVSWCTRYSRWVSQIYVNGKANRVGYFKKERDAAIAYDVAAIKAGKSQKLNILKKHDTD